MSTQNPQQYRGHNFVGVENELTPSAFRVMKWQVTKVNDKPTLVRTYQQSLITVRPKDKDMLGSSRAVWASEQIHSVQEYPAVYCPLPLPPLSPPYLLILQHSCSGSSIIATFIPLVLPRVMKSPTCSLSHVTRKKGKFTCMMIWVMLFFVSMKPVRIFRFQKKSKWVI